MECYVAVCKRCIQGYLEQHSCVCISAHEYVYISVRVARKAFLRSSIRVCILECRSFAACLSMPQITNVVVCTCAYVVDYVVYMRLFQSKVCMGAPLTKRLIPNHILQYIH